ncbi:hypothetical protein KY289_037054 [Solanum tuberosum]|nr:hypothetical protein KY289_037054 [Solanum tuberosum]
MNDTKINRKLRIGIAGQPHILIPRPNFPRYFACLPATGNQQQANDRPTNTYHTSATTDQYYATTTSDQHHAAAIADQHHVAAGDHQRPARWRPPSGSRYVTCNVHFEDIYELDAYLKVCMASDEVDLSKMASGMKEKFKTYWGTPEKMNKMLFIASVLDPRNKFVTTFYMKKQKEDSESLGVKSELDRYLLEDQKPESEDFDILIWWKVNSRRFPVLSQLTRDVLAIPMSSVASECAFSTCGRILDPFSSSLTPKCVQCLICVQDWLRQETKPICVEESLEFLEKIELEMTNSERNSSIVETMIDLQVSSPRVNTMKKDVKY